MAAVLKQRCPIVFENRVFKAIPLPCETAQSLVKQQA
jgi:hypothetical protein